MIEEGMNAPDFALPGAGNDTLRLSDHAGKWRVVYFYPKDDTPGCTTEAKDFTELLPEFKAKNAHIIGISRDSVKRHDNFRTKHALTIDLASDESGEVCEAYGVWVEKKNYGRTYMGIQRATFLVDPDGMVARTWPKVRVKNHARDVLDSIPA